jgi:predicted esterase YcpF (UPF0227 family)
VHNLLYIHGFNSSPLSVKAQASETYFQVNLPHVRFFAPQLANTPAAAFTQLCDIIERYSSQKWYLIGSSLGGFLATALSAKYHCQAVLINPAVAPYHLLSDIIGEQYNPYTDEYYQVEHQHIEELKTLEIEKIEKNNYLVMVQTGDEVLDYQLAVKKYHDCRLIIEQDGDHSFVDYDKKLPNIVEFFDLKATT